MLIFFLILFKYLKRIVFLKNFNKNNLTNFFSSNKEKILKISIFTLKDGVLWNLLKYIFSYFFEFLFSLHSLKIQKNKSIIALDALIGTVLSVLALVLVFQVFTSTFLQSPENLNIAKSNAKSIDNFINLAFDNSDISSYSDCFIMMRLRNLENFQIENSDNNKNYVYIIDRKGIYIVSFTDYINYISSNYKNFNFKPKYEFKDKLKILIDDTQKAWEINDIFGITFHNIDTKINLKRDVLANNDVKIVLEPNFDLNNYQNEFKVTVLNNPDYISKGNSDSSLLIAKNARVINSDEFDNPNLVFSLSTKELFISKNYYSNILVKNNLCIGKYLVDKNINNYYMQSNNIYNEDFLNNKIEFSCKDDKNLEVKGQFYWLNKPVCVDINNVGICKDISNNLKYSDFVNKFKDNCYKVLGHDNGGVIKIKSVTKLKFFQIEKNNNLKFNQLFDKFDYIDSSNEKKIYISYLFAEHRPSNLEEFYNHFYENHVFDNTGTFSFFNNNINGCSANICNKFVILNGEVYFYIKGYNKYRAQNIYYYKFKNYDMIKRMGDKYYFNKDEITIKKSKKLSKEDGSFFSSDTEYFYSFVIKNIEGKNYDIVLSKKQFDNIRSISN